MISAEKASTPVSVCCRLLGVSRSGYYEWASRAPSDRALTDAWLIEKIKQIHEDRRRLRRAADPRRSAARARDPRLAQARGATDARGRDLRASASQARAHHDPRTGRPRRRRPRTTALPA